MKYLILIHLIFFIPIGLLAQEEGQKRKLLRGIEISWNSNVSHENIDAMNLKQMIASGSIQIGAHLQITKNILISPLASYGFQKREGLDMRQLGFSEPTEVNTKQVGIRIPMRFYIPIGSKSKREHSYGGIEFNVGIFANYALESNLVQGDELRISKMNFKDELSKIEYGGAVSVGFYGNLFHVELGYDFGLKDTEFLDSRFNATRNSYKMKSGGWNFKIGPVVTISQLRSLFRKNNNE